MLINPTKRKIRKRALEIINSPDKWTTKWMAVNASGKVVFPSDSTAVKFCAIGAMYKASYEITKSYSMGELIIRNKGFVLTNDNEGYEAVIKKIKSL